MNTNNNIFVTKAGIKVLIVSTFVNNIKIMKVKELKVIEQVKKQLARAVDMVNMGSISFYFILEVQRDLIKKIIKIF